MTESNGNNNIFYLTGVHVELTEFDDEVNISYWSGRQVYSGRTRSGYLHEGTLPVRNLMPDIKSGLTLVEAVAGEVFAGKPKLLVHVRDLITRSVVGQPYDELLTE